MEGSQKLSLGKLGRKAHSLVASTGELATQLSFILVPLWLAIARVLWALLPVLCLLWLAVGAAYIFTLSLIAADAAERSMLPPSMRPVSGRVEVAGSVEVDGQFLEYEKAEAPEKVLRGDPLEAAPEAGEGYAPLLPEEASLAGQNPVAVATAGGSLAKATALIARLEEAVEGGTSIAPGSALSSAQATAALDRLSKQLGTEQGTGSPLQRANELATAVGC